jgi:hypothetical protein
MIFYKIVNENCFRYFLRFLFFPAILNTAKIAVSNPALPIDLSRRTVRFSGPPLIFQGRQVGLINQKKNCGGVSGNKSLAQF